MHSTVELNDIALILAAAFVGGALLRTLRQPVLVGYILVGAVFGPTGLGWVQDLEGIQWLAELGILLLMFYIGLEMDLSHFRSVARPAILTTILQIAMGVAAMYALGLLMDWPFKTALLLGFCVSLSSTAVAIKILDNMGLKAQPQGQLGMGILISQDIAIVPMMLILGAMTGSNGFHVMGLVKLGFGMLLLAVIIWLSLHPPRWFTPVARKIAKFNARAMSGQSAISALAVCFAAAALAGAYGLSAAYGAFLAGLAMGRTRSREKLQKRTQPIFDVLIMVFFLSVGLLIDLKFLAEHWPVVLKLVVAALGLKTLVNYLVLKSQGVKSRDSLLIGAVTGQIGEFAFLLAALGLQDKSLNDDTYRYVIAVISLSLMLTPIWLMVLRAFRLIPEIKPVLEGEAMEHAARRAH